MAGTPKKEWHGKDKVTDREPAARKQRGRGLRKRLQTEGEAISGKRTMKGDRGGGNAIPERKCEGVGGL